MDRNGALADLLRELRSQCGLSRQAAVGLLSDQLGQTFSKSSMQRWEEGTGLPEPRVVLQLAAIYEATEADKALLVSLRNASNRGAA